MEYMMMYFAEYLSKALLVTLLLEAPIIWFGLGMRAANKKKIIVNFLLINAITNITLNSFILCFSMFLGAIMSIGVVIAELIIPYIEAKMYGYTTNEFSRKRLLVTCYIANAVSYLLGSWLISIVG